MRSKCHKDSVDTRFDRQGRVEFYCWYCKATVSDDQIEHPTYSREVRVRITQKVSHGLSVAFEEGDVIRATGYYYEDTLLAEVFARDKDDHLVILKPFEVEIIKVVGAEE